MTDGAFAFEDCLRKHHIRRDAWLPLCRERLRLIRQDRPPKRRRRLRYFTFCAVGAIDVLMLEAAKIVRKSTTDDRLDTVFFFDRTAELVEETAKRIPGANGFPGEFVAIVLEEDPVGDAAGAALESAIADPDTVETWAKQRSLNTRRRFVESFPFDAINLDLEGFFFVPSDRLPGRLVNAMRKVFEWQRRPLHLAGAPPEELSGFSLMFTTQIGPPDLGNDYLEMLRRCLQTNLDRSPGLVDQLQVRTGLREIGQIEGEQFATYFKVASPKLLASILDDADWYVDADHGIRLFEIERQSASGPYRILHMAMQVRRKDPPLERRAPGENDSQAVSAYRAVVERLFSEEGMLVTDEAIDAGALRTDLDAIKERRRRIYPEGESQS